MSRQQNIDVTSLITKDRRARQAQLTEYINSARNEAQALGFPWDEPRWEGVGYFVKQPFLPRGGTPRKAKIGPDMCLDAAFIEFAKAYVTERHLTNPGESQEGHTKRLQTLRLVEAALLDLRGLADPLDIDAAVFDEVARRVSSVLAAGGPYKVGRELETLAGVMVRRGVLPAICEDWTNPNKGPKNTNIAVDAESQRKREQRLPNHDALYVLADIFNRTFDLSDERVHRDIYTTSITALLMSAPSRGEEIHRLPLCLVIKATDKFGTEQTGLRLEASKGFGAYVKWVWSEMVPVAELAIERVKTITQEARNLAKHLEGRNAGRFYRHPNCPKVADNAPLTAEQVCFALGYAINNVRYSAGDSLRGNGLSGVDGTYTLQRLWDEVVLPRHRQLHPHFPYVSAKDKARGKKGGLKFSEALFCMLRHQLHQWNGTSPVQLWLPDLKDFRVDVGPSPQTNIFERYGYMDPSGKPFKLTSHPIRHLLNTEAQRVGLTDEQIAHWSGRRVVAQNTTYDHRTIEERVDQTREVVERVQSAVALPNAEPTPGADVVHGQWVIKLVRKPRALRDIEDIQPHLAGLKTLYGECHHDWSFAPCEGFVKCLDCSEHACIKGSDSDAKTKLERLEALREGVIRDVAKARKTAEEDIDAQDWLKVQERYAAKVDQLISILQNDSVPDGAVIRSADGQHPTHMHRALRGLAIKAIEQGGGSNEAMTRLLQSIESGIGGNDAGATLIASALALAAPPEPS